MPPTQGAAGCPPSPPPACRASASQRAVLVLRNADDDARDLLKWKVSRGGRAAVADLRNPATGEPTLLLCLYDGSGAAQPLLSGRVVAGGTCGARPCWRPIGATGYRYKNRAAEPDGVTDLRLKVTGPGELQLALKGKGARLGVPSLGLTTPVAVVLVVEDPPLSTCWQATFPTAIRNDAATFKAVAP